MLFVLVLILANIMIMSLHIILEGTVANFEVQKVSSKEKPSALQGVN